MALGFAPVTDRVGPPATTPEGGGAPATVSEKPTVRVKPPAVPVTTIAPDVVAGALAAALRVMVTGAAGVRLIDEKRAVTPAGSPVADSATGELNPPCALIVRVVLTELPAVTLRLAESAASAKLDVVLVFQLLTSRKASTEPSPVVKS